jgi:transposase
MRCEEPVKIMEILRLWELGYSQRAIAASVKCAKSTVGEVQYRSRKQELGYAEASTMTNDKILERLYPKLPKPNKKADLDWKSIHQRRQENRRFNLRYSWEEYRMSNPDGLGYSQYCRRYHLWREKTGKEVVMVQEREPGKELFVDWMGDTLDCVVNSITGELYRVHFFVAVLGDSSYPYVEAFADEKEASWLLGHVHALEWIGGVPRVMVPDNLKASVIKPSYYDPKLNPAYWELAKHYGVAVIPARIRKPKDKAPVESNIGWLETWLLEWLRGQRFLSLEELNSVIRDRVKELAKRPFQKRPGCRQGVFEAVDKPALNPLPAVRYEHAEYITRRVPCNYHVEYDGFFYSTPFSLYKQPVTLRVTSEMVEIINGNRERVALHPRRRNGARYVTNTAHMPKSHQHQYRTSHRNGDSYRCWADEIGENTSFVIDSMLQAQRIEEMAYRSCMGILQLGKKQGNDRLEEACRQARGMGSLCYTTVKSLIQNPHPQPKSIKPLPLHNNLRHPTEFS